MHVAECDRAVAYSYQTAYRYSEGIEDPPYLAVSAFVQRHAIPDISSRAAFPADLIELGNAVIEVNASLELSELLASEFAHETRRILARYLVAGMHESMSQFAVGRQQQESGGAYVESSDGYPTTVSGRFELTEDRPPSLRIAAARDLAHGFVVQAMVLALTFARSNPDRSPIELDLLSAG